LLAGEPPTGDAPPVPLPRGLVSTRDLTATLGATAAREIATLAVGDVSEVLEVGDGFHVVQVLERREGRLPPFEEAREVVLGEHRRRAAEGALRSFLDARRRESEIVVAEAP